MKFEQLPFQKPSAASNGKEKHLTAPLFQAEDRSGQFRRNSVRNELYKDSEQIVELNMNDRKRARTYPSLFFPCEKHIHIRGKQGCRNKICNRLTSPTERLAGILT